MSEPIDPLAGVYIDGTEHDPVRDVVNRALHILTGMVSELDNLPDPHARAMAMMDTTERDRRKAIVSEAVQEIARLAIHRGGRAWPPERLRLPDDLVFVERADLTGMLHAELDRAMEYEGTLAGQLSGTVARRLAERYAPELMRDIRQDLAAAIQRHVDADRRMVTRLEWDRLASALRGHANETE